jgi:hypothetical protein
MRLAAFDAVGQHAAEALRFPIRCSRAMRRVAQRADAGVLLVRGRFEAPAAKATRRRAMVASP